MMMKYLQIMEKVDPNVVIAKVIYYFNILK